MWGKVPRESDRSAISNTADTRVSGSNTTSPRNWTSSFKTLQKNPSFIIEGPYKRFSTQKIPQVARISEVSAKTSTTISRDSENHYPSSWSSSYSTSTPQKVSLVADRPLSRFSLQKVQLVSRPLKVEKLDSNETATSTAPSSTQLEDSKLIVTRRLQYQSTEEFLKQVLMSESSFRRLPANELVNAMWKHLMWTGDTLFRQGDVSNSYFIVTSGRLDILVENNRGQMEKVSEIQRGASLGANGLMGSTKRMATVVASTPCTLWVLEAVSFRRIVRKYRTNSFDARFLGRLTFLKTVPIFNTLPHRYLEKLATVFREVQYAKGTTIIRQSDPPKSFYLLKSGTAVVLKKSKLQTVPVQVHSYGPTDFFGERGLIRKQPRAASVVATTEATCFLLGEADFAEIGKFLAKQFEQVISSYEDVKIQTETAMFPKFVNRIDTKLGEFKFLGILGIGSFGQVSLVKDPNTNKTYSLKGVRKIRVVETGQQEHMKNERAVQAIMDSPFIVKLYATYQDRARVYLLMEAVLGGELFTVLRYNGKFSERTSRFYASCCVQAFEHMHSKNVIYRDLKPENLMLDERGYIKITDFGFAKKRNNTSTLCGTPEYLAPEVIRNLTQSFGVDWWGLGILIYEMVVSHPPFEDAEHLKMYEKILRKPVDYPRHVTQTCRDVIDSLLRKNFRRRLGSGPGGAAAVRQHIWFKDFKWDGLVKSTLKSPYVPRIKNREDLSCFEYYPDDEFKYEEEVYVDDNSTVFAWTADF